MRILITGSSGFIGTEVARQAESYGHEAYGYDLSPPPEGAPLAGFKKGSILEPESLDAYVEAVQPQALIHLAAACDISDRRTEEAGLASYAENIEGTRNVVEIVGKSKCVERVIYTSTQLVSQVGHQPDSLEDCSPTTFYGKSKLIGEKIVHESSGDKPCWTIVRPTSVWGPGMGPYYCKFIDYVVSGKYFHISNAPLNKSYSYISNIAYQYHQLLMASQESVHQETFYLADYEPLSLRRYADLLQEELGAKPLRTFPESLCRVMGRFGDVVQRTVYPKFPFTSFRVNNILTEYVYNLSKTEAVCGDLPVSFEEGVALTARWYAENRQLQASAGR